MANHGDWQFGIYFNGLVGQKPSLPMEYGALERAAEAAMTEEVWSYVAGGAGNEHTQRINVHAFERWGLMPRMLSGAAQRELGVELFGQQLPSPLMLAPVGVIGICEPEGHGDLTTARAAATTGVPMIASTLMQDPMEDVAAALGDTPAGSSSTRRTTASSPRAWSGGPRPPASPPSSSRWTRSRSVGGPAT